MKAVAVSFALVLAGAPAACGGTPPRDDLTDGLLVLPPELREVSAITVLDERTLACLQDEAGALFFVDLAGEKPTRAAVFAEPGDYEGVARVGDDFWVLRSDGKVLHLVVRDGALTVASAHDLPAGHAEWEALCYDADRTRLLASPKDSGRKGRDDERVVYAIDPRTGAVADEPALVLDREKLVDDAEARGIALPTRTTPKGKERVHLRLVCSEILAVPGSDHLWLLSVADRALLEVDRGGRLVAATLLDAKDLPQPEGLARLPDGRWLVASEGSAGPGIVRVVKAR